MELSMDWGKESDRGGSTLYPEGTYKVVIDTYERTTAKTGTNQIRWKARIIQPVEHEGKKITEHTALSEKALWKLAWLVSACGIEVSKLGKMDVNSSAFNRILKACEGRTAYWHLKVGLDLKGNERNEVDDYKRDEDQEVVDIAVNLEDIPSFLKEN